MVLLHDFGAAHRRGPVGFLILVIVITTVEVGGTFVLICAAVLKELSAQA